MDSLTNPVVIIEVLSDSTDSYDRGAKFELYKGLPSLHEYIVVDQHSAFIQVYRKVEDGPFWTMQSYVGLDTTLHIAAISVDVPLTQIYARVDVANTLPHHPSVG